MKTFFKSLPHPRIFPCAMCAFTVIQFYIHMTPRPDLWWKELLAGIEPVNNVRHVAQQPGTQLPHQPCSITKIFFMISYLNALSLTLMFVT